MNASEYQEFCRQQNQIAIAEVGDIKADMFGRTLSQLEGDERYARMGDDTFQPMPGDYAAAKIKAAKSFQGFGKMIDTSSNDD